jgi:glycosyltransferase involved in cell wall biosynthesis
MQHGNGQSPLFTIVIPTRNRPDMLRRAVLSACRQTFASFEIIVIDDASDQQGRDVLKDFSAVAIRVLRMPERVGVAAARNVGIESAQGQYVSFLDDDDEYLPSFLEATASRLCHAAPNAGFSWTGVKVIEYPKTDGSGHQVAHCSFDDVQNDPELLMDRALSIGTGFGVTARVAVLRALGCFDPSLHTVEDTDLFIRLLQHGYTPTIVPGVHVVIHNHRKGRLTDAQTAERRARETLLLLERHRAFLSIYPLLETRLRMHYEVLNASGRAASGDEREWQ